MNNKDSKWQNFKIGDFMKEFSQKSVINNQYEILSVTKEGIFSQKKYFKKQIASDDNIGYKIVKNGDIVFSSMNLWMGAIDVVKDFERGMVSPAYVTMRPEDKIINTKFLSYFLKGVEMRKKYIYHSQQGASVVRRNLDKVELLSDSVKIPTIPEQEKIAEILSSINSLIKSLKEKINKEKIISIAIGRNLLEKVSLNNSYSIGDIFKVDNGSTPSRSKPRFFCKSQGLPWLKTMDLTDNYVYKTDEELRLSYLKEAKVKIFPAGTVLVAMYGGWNQIGRTGILTRDSACNQAMSALICNEKVIPEFLNMQLVLNRSYWRKVAASSRKDPNITKSDVKSMKIYIPSISEQEKISRIYSSHLNLIKVLQKKLKSLINLQSALASDLLSGRKRVTL